MICKPGDSIKISGNYFDFNAYEIAGSPESAEINLLKEKTQSFLTEIAEFARIIEDSIYSPDYAKIRQETDEKYRQAFQELKSFSRDFIKRNSASLVSLLALSNEVGKDFFVFHPVKDFEVFQSLDSTLYPLFSDYEAVKNLHYQVSKIEREILSLSSGSLNLTGLPDFKIYEPDGDSTLISSVISGNAVVFFWASWCRPCIAEMNKLISEYNKNALQGIDFIAISIDDDLGEMEKAFSELKDGWKQYFVRNSWNSEAIVKTGINKLPHFYFVSEGEIIGQNFKPEDLRKFTDSIKND
jgi:thiol-disulfide isomerase/thioredoxin